MPLLTIQLATRAFDGQTAEVATLIGSADASNIMEIDTQIANILVKNQTLILDLSQLTYANSTFIGHLTDWYSQVTEKNGQFILVGCQPQVFDTLNVVGLLTLIPHYMTMEEAENALTQARPAAQNSGAL